MKTPLILLLTILSTIALAQTKFTYDAAGNRIKRENSGNALVTVDAKVYIRGAVRGANALMANELQTYFTATSGLLPATDPYGGGVTYNNIGNPGGVAGAIVDWVRVEIRDAANPLSILQYKNLLLKTNGSIVDVDGTFPKFVAQANPVHLTIKHRNHIAILSNPIPAFSSGTVVYDFTTALNKAASLALDPPQMVQANGKWCMWPADVDGDLAITATDYNIVYYANSQSKFDIYLAADCNLDGGVDGTDMNIVYASNTAGLFSTLANYEYQ